MTSNDTSAAPPAEPQQIDTPLTRSAIFVVLKVSEGTDAAATARGVLGGLDDLVKTVAFRDMHSSLTCTVGIGHDAFERITRQAPPAALHPFVPVAGATHTAPSTPGDLLFHIRADYLDLCFEFEKLLLASFGQAASVVDETFGFRYFDARDLLGFVDGTANPVGPALPEASLVGDEDPAFVGGSYVVVQKYTHDIDAWQHLTTEQQEAIIGRRKLDNVELDDATGDAQKSHKTLNTITDAEGEHDIVRDNMPFGRPGHGEFGTYFIGYSRHLWVTERMLERMFIGDPPGKHDRILDFSTPQTGTTFFAPSATFLAALGD
ncbi:Dyp-type peroxidase [uncultured Microbacterium sp.]|uniref:Dyp-type peroxidase n=1 Tax=uncultured Microbacterium sp. TaxID=191216 RepID=UPI0025DC6BA8|nr:Dyp-type peroxidase [uncultured Microbacterium sp.]